MLLGICFGVSIVIAIDIANSSAFRSFQLSTQSITGKATHRITSGSLGLDQDIYFELRKSGAIDAAAPVIQDKTRSVHLGNEPLELIGLDPFADMPFRNYFNYSSDPGSRNRLVNGIPDQSGLISFLTQPGAIYISKQLADRYAITACHSLTDPQVAQNNCLLELIIAGKEKPAFVAGFFDPQERLYQLSTQNYLIADIATAQELTDRLGEIDRIDLILDDACGIASPCFARIETALPPGVALQKVSEQNDTITEMTQAFRLNLTALSFLSLLVGMFLIYNTMTYAVISRRPLFGTLRCLGVTRREVFLLILVEAVAIGSIASAFGVLLGILLGQWAVEIVSRSINDLFFVISVRDVPIPVESLIKGFVLGVLTTLISSALPAWEAASVPPRSALSRSGLESKAFHSITLAATGGLALILTGTICLLTFTRSLELGFTGTFFIVLGSAMLVPFSTRLILRLVGTRLSILGSIGRLAPSFASKSLSRTVVAIMALMVAIAVSIGVGLMISSFRSTVITWLSTTLQGDIYLSVPDDVATSPFIPIDSTILIELEKNPGIERINLLRSVLVTAPMGQVQVSAVDDLDITEDLPFLSLEGSRDSLWERMLSGELLISEPFAYRNNLSTGDSVDLMTSTGVVTFPIAGIFQDYGASQGKVMLALPVYRAAWQDQTITAISLELSANQDVSSLMESLKQNLLPLQSLEIILNKELRAEVLRVFDRTFVITSALQVLSILVAFIGVINAMLSIELDRQRELGILRAVGLTARQLWQLILAETGLLGFIAGVLAIPLGFVLAIILIYIINLRSFGWTLQMQVELGQIARAVLIALAAALLGGLFPARKISRMTVAEALHAE
jgi:putative ABC transport system permease protein